jgi:hypothetical protein
VILALANKYKICKNENENKLGTSLLAIVLEKQIGFFSVALELTVSRSQSGRQKEKV